MSKRKHEDFAVGHATKLSNDISKAGHYRNNGELPKAVKDRLHKICKHLIAAGYDKPETF